MDALANIATVAPIGKIVKIPEYVAPGIFKGTTKKIIDVEAKNVEKSIEKITKSYGSALNPLKGDIKKIIREES